MNLFNLILINPIINILVAIYQGLVFLHVPSPLGFAIILLTVVIRLVLYPLTGVQLKSSKKMQAVAPHISKLREKHKGDMQRIQQETMLLYKEHGINPVAGCLPVVIQLPIIWSLYAVLQKVVGLRSHESLADINNVIYFSSLKLHHLWATDFFGIPLGATISHLMTTIGPLILVVPILTGVLQFIQSKMMFPTQPAVEKKDNKDKKADEQDFATAFQSQSMYIFPAMIAFFSYSFPFGLSLYWNTFTIFGIIQQYQVQGLGGLEEWIGRIRNANQTKTLELDKPKKKK